MKWFRTDISKIRTFIRHAALFLVFTTSLFVLAADGLIIEHADGSVEYFGDNAVCTSSPGGVYSVVRDGKILMAFKPSGKFWLGSAEEWCAEMKKMTGEAEEQLGGLPAKYTIQKVGVETVGGRPATHYSIMLDGGSVQEIWVNEEAKVAGHIKKLESSLDYMDCAESGGIFQINGMDLQPAVEELEKKGLIVKRQDPFEQFDDPYETETVTSIRFGDIPADKLSLAPPAGLKAVGSVMALFGAQ